MDEPDLSKSSDSIITIDSNDSVCDERSFFIEFPTSANERVSETQDPLGVSTEAARSPEMDQIEFCSTGLRPIITYSNDEAVLTIPDGSFNTATMKTESGSLDTCDLEDFADTSDIDEEESMHRNDEPSENKRYFEIPGTFRPISEFTSGSTESSLDGNCSMLADANSSFNHHSFSGGVQIKEEISPNTETGKKPDVSLVEILNVECINEFPIIDIAENNNHSDKVCPEESIIKKELSIVLNQVSHIVEIDSKESTLELAKADLTNNKVSTSEINNNHLETELKPRSTNVLPRIDLTRNISDSDIVRPCENITKPDMQTVPNLVSSEIYYEENVESSPVRKRLKLECSNELSIVELTHNNNNNSIDKELLSIPNISSLEINRKENGDTPPLRKRFTFDCLSDLSIIDLTLDDNVRPDDKPTTSSSNLLKEPEDSTLHQVESAKSCVSIEPNAIEDRITDAAQPDQSLTDQSPQEDESESKSVTESDSDQTDDSDREADDNRDELIRQCDLQQGSQRILDDDSDTDDEPLAKIPTPEEMELSGRYWDDECSQLMRQCGLGGSKEQSSVADHYFAVPKIPFRNTKENDKTLEDLLNQSDLELSPPMSSQLIDIEMAALAVEIATSEEDWLQKEQEIVENEPRATVVPTDIDFREERQTNKPQTHKPNARYRKFYADPLPLMIDDVLQLLSGPVQGRTQLNHFGLQFTRIAFYGRCTPVNYSTKGQPNTMLRRMYEVDDGTSSVNVTFEHFSKERTVLYKEVQQVERNLVVQR